MPITRSAKKKVRQDKKRYISNTVTKQAFRKAIKAFKSEPNEKQLTQMYSSIDKAAKKGVIHANKAARLKSRLTKLLAKKPAASKKENTETKQKKVKTGKKNAAKHARLV